MPSPPLPLPPPPPGTSHVFPGTVLSQGSSPPEPEPLRLEPVSYGTELFKSQLVPSAFSSVTRVKA
ncbi:hypothetical protein B5P22_25310 [Pseudomonas tolaasii]|nr:hypothetical protein B5P22_25310 [Pseudomonas tolaasii]